ncbi:hypothetical protein OAZ15_02900 [Pelagibacteraceae bacterium]|nr:hypothetical protein [Pelagibacteraceae bacterium]
MTISKFREDEDLINVRNEVDRFGFSHFLANKMQIKNPPRSFANWQHGWYWGDLEISELDMVLGYPKINNYNIPTIVADENIKNALKGKGFTNVFAGGIPFSYIPKTESKRINDSIIVVMPHSLEYINFSSADNFNELVNSISQLSKRFSKVDCLVFYDDYVKKIYDNYFKNQNINLICGARANSKNSLIYIRSIFDKYEYVISNCIGSAILYSMFCNCKVSIIEPFFNYSYEFWLSDPYLRDNKNLIDLMIYHHSEDYLKKKYKFLFNSDPKLSKTNYDIAKKLIGFSYQLKIEEIKELLGWTTFSKFKAMYRYFSRRIK